MSYSLLYISVFQTGTLSTQDVCPSVYWIETESNAEDLKINKTSPIAKNYIAQNFNGTRTKKAGSTQQTEASNI